MGGGNLYYSDMQLRMRCSRYLYCARHLYVRSGLDGFDLCYTRLHSLLWFTWNLYRTGYLHLRDWLDGIGLHNCCV